MSFFKFPALNRSSRLMLSKGAMLFATLVASAAVLIWQNNGQTFLHKLHQLEMQSGLMKAYALRILDSGNRVQDGLSRDLALPAPGQLVQLKIVMTNCVAGRPFLSGFAPQDEQVGGISSITVSERGRPVDLSRLTASPLPSRSMTECPWLRDPTTVDMEVATESVGLVPLARPIPLPGGGAAWLVAQFESAPRLPLFEDQADAVILHALGAGALLAQAGNHPLHAVKNVPYPTFSGVSLRSSIHDALEPWGGNRFGASQVSSRSPLESDVALPNSVTSPQWLAELRSHFFFIALAVVLIGVLTSLFWRHARALKHALQKLETAHHETTRNGQQLALLVKSVQELIFRTDLHGSIRFANARWQTIAGEGAHLARGRYWRDLVLLEHREQVEALFDPQSDLGVRTAQVSLQCANGQLRVLNIAVVPLSSPDGEIRGFAGSAVDVTEQLLAQQQLEGKLALAERLLECNPLPICLTNIEGRFVAVNEAWEKFMNLPRGKVLGRRHVDFLSAQEAQAYDAHNTQLLHEGGRVSYEERLRCADGSVRDVQITKVKLTSSCGEPLGILATKVDITAFHAARDMANEAARTKVEFVANISHELRTPLQSILGFSELGLMRGREHTQLAAMFRDIHTSGRNMLALVNDLLDIAKIESNVGAFHFERMDIREVIENVTGEMQSLLQRKQIKLNLELGPLPLFAKVDPHRFQQVVRNILANALKFSHEGAPIDVTACVQDGSSIHIEVRDYGPGIPPAELEAVFQAFVQSSQIRKGAGGTGLGLLISRKIVDVHGGRVYATNARNGGAILHIEIPTASYSDTMPAPLA